MKRIRRTLILLLLTAIGFFITFIATETGLRTSLWLLKVVIPTQFSYGEVKGRLISNFSIRHLYYRDAYSQIHLDHISARWSLGDIFQRKITVTNPQISNADIHFFPAPTSPGASEPIQDLSLPFHLVFKNCNINQLKITLQQHTYIITQSNFNITLNHDQVEISKLTLSSNYGGGNFNGKLSLIKPFQVHINNDIEMHLNDSLIGIKGNIFGNVNKILIKQNISKDSQGKIDIELSELLNQPKWNGNIHIETSPFLEKYLDTRESVTGFINSKGSADFFTIDGKLVSSIEGNHYNLLFATETNKLTDWVIKSLRLNAGHMNLFMSGYYSDTGYGINAYWDKFNWKIPDALSIFSNKGTLSLSGKSDTYQYQLDGNIRIPDILPVSNWHVKGSGSWQDMYIEDAKIEIMNGQLNFLYALDWSDDLRWTGSIASKNIDLSYYFPGFRSAINSEFAVFGSHSKDDLINAGINLVFLSGKINQAPLNGSGSIDYHPHDIFVDDLNIKAGKNSIRANGRFAKQSIFDISVNFSDLRSLSKIMKGQVKAKARLKENSNQGQLEGFVSAQNLSFNNISINQTQADFSLHSRNTWSDLTKLDLEQLLLAIKTSNIRFHSQGIKAFQKPIENLKLEIFSKEKSAKVQLSMDAEFGKAKMDYLAEHTGKIWQGNIQTLQYVDPQLGAWSSGRPGRLDINASNIMLTQTCLNQRRQSICIEGNWNKEQAQLGARLENFAISSLSDFLPENLFLSTLIDRADLKMNSLKGQWNGSLRLDTSNGQITYLMPNGEFLSFSHKNAKVTAQIKDNEIQSFVSLPITEGLGELKTKIKLDHKPKLKLGTNIQLNNINNFVSVIPELQDTNGRLNIGININDALHTPKFSGSLTFDQGSTKIPRLGLVLSNISLALETKNEDFFHLIGQAKSNNGLIKIDSLISTHLDENWKLQGSIVGSQFLAANMPEYRVTTSPNLKMTIGQNSTILNGEITIPHARLNPRDLSTATLASSDEVIVNKHDDTVTTKPYKVQTKLRLKLGKDVRFKGFGLKCRLEGNLTITDQPNAPTLGNGEIRIVEGKYQAYNQNFDIQTGKLLFAGGPVSNPAIHLTAYRQLKEVKVGIKVRGTLINPVLTLVSEPVMDESDILAYLIFERPIGQINNEEQGKDLQKLALEVIGNEILASKIGRKLGLEDIRLQSSESTKADSGVSRDISLVVGKYLSPKLYVSYGVGLIEHAQSLNVRYNITKKLSFEASKGAEAGGDFIYTIERDKK